LIENHRTARELNALPIALSDGCTLLTDVGKDQVVGFDAVRLPAGRISDALWAEQCARWPQAAPLAAAAGSRRPAKAGR
jgi:predicted homoserine dehydrogenase-like protein